MSAFQEAHKRAEEELQTLQHLVAKKMTQIRTEELLEKIRDRRSRVSALSEDDKTIGYARNRELNRLAQKEALLEYQIKTEGSSGTP